MLFILALIPILLILGLMVGLSWSAARAGGAGYLAALLIAVVFFGAGPELLAYAHARALLLSLDVLLIIWAAFLLYRVADEAGAIRIIGQALPHLTPDRGLQGLIIGWVFASFLQGVGGFGVPTAVIAPILVGLGFTPLTAVILPSLGHGWAVTYGSLGSSFQALLSATGLPAGLLAGPAAIFLGISGVLVGFQVAHAAGGWEAVRRLWLPVLLFSGVMGGVQWAAAGAGLWAVAAFLAGLAGLLVAVPLALFARKTGRNRSAASGDRSAASGDRSAASENPSPQNVPVAENPGPGSGHPLLVVELPDAPAEGENQAAPTTRRLLTALSGYLLLIVVILSVQLIPALNQALGGLIVHLEFPEVSTSLGYVTPEGSGRQLVILRHTGTVLAYSALLAYIVYRLAGWYQPGAPSRIVKGTVRRVMGSSVSIASMVAMAVVMENTGMTDELARGLAETMGSLFPITAPWIGAIGAFMTGSNTNSNVVFGALQMRTAELLQYPVAIILAGQTAGAALASVMAPTKVVVGASTAGMAGREGEVMRKMALYTLTLVVLISGLTWGTILLWGK